MRYFFPSLSIWILFFACESSPTSESILEQSIQYHDPKKEWANFSYELYFDEYRADHQVRKTVVKLDLPNGRYRITRDGQFDIELKHDSLVNVSGEINSERAQMMKNYYLYLWGLPMKLADENTPLDTWELSEWEGYSSISLKVAYEKDTWFFHFDPNSYQMIGYKFYTDSALTHGEIILLEGVETVSDMKLPKERKWYSLPDREYLGKDVLTHVKKL